MVGLVAFASMDDWIMCVSFVGLVSPAMLLMAMSITVSRSPTFCILLRSTMSLIFNFMGNAVKLKVAARFDSG